MTYVTIFKNKNIFGESPYKVPKKKVTNGSLFDTLF